MNAGDQTERSWTSQRTKVVGDVSQWMSDKSRELAEAFERGTTVGAIVEKFGDDRLDGGLTLGDALAVLPTATRLQRPEELLDILSDRAAGAMARDGLVAEALVANIGFNAQLDDIANVPMQDFKAVPMEARKALVEGGIRTLGAFQQAGPRRIARILATSGMRIDIGTASRWSGEAMVVGKVAGKVR